MRVSFLISAEALGRLGFAASERGWRSDPDYAARVVARTALGGGGLAMPDHLAAMCADFDLVDPVEVVRAIGAFFSERPACVEIAGQDYRVGATLRDLRPAG
jgi:hypothetical protein